MGNNENDLSDNIYEQLQKTLNECMNNWYEYILLKKSNRDHFVYEKDWLRRKWSYYMSYHELFSKDSWLMEFVEWEYKYKWTHVNFHYMMMGIMTAEEKIQYFISNAILWKTNLPE